VLYIIFYENAFKCASLFHSRVTSPAVLDGIMAIGKSWNIVTLYHGKTNLELKYPVRLDAGSFKGIETLKKYKNVIQLDLVQLGRLSLSLLFVKQVREFKKNQASQKLNGNSKNYILPKSRMSSTSKL